MKRGRRNWPTNVTEQSIFSWLQETTELVAKFSQCVDTIPIVSQGLVGSLDRTDKSKPYAALSAIGSRDLTDWEKIMAPIELKNTVFLNRTITWLHLAGSALSVFTAQHRRSAQINVNEEGEKFVFVIAGLLTMERILLGFDPSITTTKRRSSFSFRTCVDGNEHRVILDEIIRQQCLKWYIFELCDAVFPDKVTWKKPDFGLHGKMQEILCRRKERLEKIGSGARAETNMNTSVQVGVGAGVKVGVETGVEAGIDTAIDGMNQPE
uniref:Fungal-type protein kinase domain-containing protein n=1 Tax=Thielaviopsis musarum TaxID=1580842 RepID=A0A2R4ZUG0_9PEZI|nr:TPA_exp: hypothetical protein [Thielaviopsis musarum]